MSPAPTQNPPLSRKIIVGFLFAVVAAVLQAVAPDYNPDPLVQSAISIAVGYAASWAVKEQLKYLLPAVAKRQSEL